MRQRCTRRCTYLRPFLRPRYSALRLRLNMIVHFLQLKRDPRAHDLIRARNNLGTLSAEIHVLLYGDYEKSRFLFNLQMIHQIHEGTAHGCA